MGSDGVGGRASGQGRQRQGRTGCGQGRCAPQAHAAQSGNNWRTAHSEGTSADRVASGTCVTVRCGPGVFSGRSSKCTLHYKSSRLCPLDIREATWQVSYWRDRNIQQGFMVPAAVLRSSNLALSKKVRWISLSRSKT